MNRNTTGTITTIGILVALGAAGLAGWLGLDSRATILAGFGIVCVLVNEAMKWSARRYLLGALALFPSAAHALAFFIFAAIAIGAGVFLIARGAIALWSSWLTVEPMLQRNEVARVTVTQPLEVAAFPDDEIADGAYWSYTPMRGISLSGTKDQSVEFSTNCVDWIPAPTFPPEGPMGFWRVR